MFIKSIRLHNIRSYENAEINFPLGSVLLAGDIGSGKSTILLAIEFAIFGAKKGELPAYTLLRHGKKEGQVELRMQIDSKDVIIKRTLKRSNNDIKQEAGYVIMNGLKKEGTAEELRAVVLDLLGYPKDLIKKGKDLIYRYTVYTPQEQMKQILYESKEIRLETLRKVFNIDKYKKIKENSRIVINSLREKKKHFEGFIIDLDYKKSDAEKKNNEILELDNSINEILPKIKEIKYIIGEKRKSINQIEKDISELNSLRKELSVAESSISHKIEQNNRLNDELRRLDIQIEQLNVDIAEKKMDDLNTITQKIGLKENEIEELDVNYNKLIKVIRELEVKIEHCNETAKKMQDLDTCPVCEQNVEQGHKNVIIQREGKKREELARQIEHFMEEESKYEKLKPQLKKEIDSLIKEQNHLNILKLKIENLHEKISSKEEKSGLKDKIKKEIGILNTKKAELFSNMEKYKESEVKYKVVKKEMDELMPQERFLDLEKQKYETEKESIKRFVASLEKEIIEKQKAKEQLAYISQLGNWIDELFVNLMSTMEKHVMVNIHSQFNDLFREWFDLLMQDESLNIRVDEEFTPIIEQDGYETFIENLSGGEKTSVSLSYRLALNKVINDIVVGIKTKDIIMLDEPTDGFSTEQLDNVRNVLDQLGMKQIILVSHESKIESFVQNVIRIHKEDHISATN